MSKETSGEAQIQGQSKHVPSAEELRKRVKEALEKANALLAESGKHEKSDKSEEEEKPK